MFFNIFWIDDSMTWIDSIRPDVERIFTELGFDPRINVFPEGEQAKESIFSTYADLILVDYTLPDDIRGDQLINEFRKNRCFAQVVFYSQDPRNLVKVTDDTHFTHVTSRSEIADTLNRVAKQSFSSYMHPAFMRGLLLSEFIDLESLMDTLVSNCFKENAGYFHRTIIHKGGESFSLSTKMKFIFSLIKETRSSSADIATEIDNIDLTARSFEQKIIRKRNILAHAQPYYDDATHEITLMSAINDVVFDRNWFHQTREDIHIYKDKIRAITKLALHDYVAN